MSISCVATEEGSLGELGAYEKKKSSLIHGGETSRLGSG